MTMYRLSELASIIEAELVGDPDHIITGVENLEAASNQEAAFLENPRYEKQLENSQAGVVIMQPTAKQFPGKNYLLTANPSLSFQKIIELYIQSPPSGFEGIHPTAVVHPAARISENVTIGPYTVIDQGVEIASYTTIGAHGFIGAKTRIGSHCFFHPRVTVREDCEIGSHVILQPGVVIGSCGFGYFTDRKGKHTALPQVGRVIIEDDVEIGANTTVDRARFKETRIKNGTKIDNLVQIAHQVELGEDNLIVSQVGIAGSTRTGRNVVMGGQVGVAGHLTIASGAILAARTAVSKSLLEPGTYGGVPAVPMKEAYLQFIQQKNLGKLGERVRQLEAQVKQFEQEKEPAS